MMRLSNKGFTLLELIVATGILLVVISGLLVTFVYCLLLNESNNNLVMAANDAQAVLEEIKGLSYNQIQAYTSGFNSTKFNNLGSETVSFPGSVFAAGSTDITVNISWVERERARNFAFLLRQERYQDKEAYLRLAKPDYRDTDCYSCDTVDRRYSQL